VTAITVCLPAATSVQAYVQTEVLISSLTSEFLARKNAAVMIIALRKPLDTCTLPGRYSPSWSHTLLGQFQARVVTIEF
jgi:hypothetical protein